MQIVEQGVLCAGVPGAERAVATFPSVTVLEDGSLAAVYRVGASKDSAGSITEIRRSHDNGRTWSEPAAPFETTFEGVRGSLQVVYLTVIDKGHLMACALWVDRDAFPGAPLFHAETEGCLPMKILIADSFDNAASFSTWREVAVTADIGPPSLTSPIIRMIDGRLIISIETNKPYLDRSTWLQRVVHCESTDDGQTWTLPRTVIADPTGAIFHWDQRLAVDNNNTLAAFSWTYDKAANKYLPIRRHISRDAGHTWTTDTLDFSDQPSHPAVFPDGRSVLAWVDRYGARSIKARQAPTLDGHFAPATEVTLYEAAKEARKTGNTAQMLTDMGLWTFGLPYAEALPNGQAIIVYYAGVEGAMDIRWARCEIF
ncbi:MAG: exo-alpha-sialidase [Acidobacteria bacterium]|nr:exo-alpha-sialidase [Acidobacteriota bacterium]